MFRNMNSFKAPLLFAALISVGIFIGARLNFSNNSQTVFSLNKGHFDKLNEVLNYIEAEYVDTISKDKLVEKSIDELLQNLDPHSSYIPAEDLQASNEPLQGNFDGIGIEFNIISDTLRVISPISGGPSEAVGILAGDKIVKVEGKNIAGVKISNKGVVDKLRGASGTKVNVGILRRGNPKILSFTITRGKIPIYSIDASFMVNINTGYIKINRFAATTYEEYISSAGKLKSAGMTSLILDLRGNPGGYLNAAIDLADEFLGKGKQIVYTQGKAHPKKVYVASEKGAYEKTNLVLLIDEGSASASEILAGAIQDNDRGTIIGTRSFGKGLVQEQSEFPDGSAIRLTIARYYTPTGRCIQKSYSEGKEAYYNEENDRLKHGELSNADSVKFIDSLKFTTPAGKMVYGGGGIMPDIFVPIDTSGRSLYLAELFYKGLINQFAFDYADRKRTFFGTYKSFSNFNNKFEVGVSLMDEFVEFAEKNKVKKNSSELKHSEKIIKNQLKALIARNIWKNEGYYPVIESEDNTFQKAVEVLKLAEKLLPRS